FVARPDRRGESTWSVLAEVPLDQGANEVTLRTWNEDGASPERSQRLVYQKPVEPKPDVLAETPEKVGVGRRTAPLRLQVRSASTRARLQLIRERSSSSRTVVEEFPVGGLARGTAGDFEFHGDRLLALEPGPNSYTVVAVNAGGEASAEFLFTYTPPP